MGSIRRLVICVICLVLMMAMVPLGALSVSAVTFTELNANNVFLKQEGKSTCTLSACAMLMRRYSLLRGDATWDTITETAIRPVAWLEGVGIYWFFEYGTNLPTPIAIGRATLPGGDANEAILQELLKSHPEGLVIYHSGSDFSHAVVLTDYTDGVYYCGDPSPGIPTERIPLDTCHKVRIHNATSYWYITSPAVSAPTPDAPSEPEPVLGDADGDGNVNNKDLGLLLRYLNAWDVSVNEKASDVTRDGRLNNKDLGVLQRYINGWDIGIDHPPSE